MRSVTKYEFNVEIPISEFRFEFPAGTFVTDERNKERWILREGGKKRMITQPEINAGWSYEQLAATEPGMTAGPTGPTGRRWPLPVLIFALVICLSVFVVRRLRRRMQGVA